jgi:hypothetical protein
MDVQHVLQLLIVHHVKIHLHSLINDVDVHLINLQIILYGEHVSFMEFLDLEVVLM